MHWQLPLELGSNLPVPPILAAVIAIATFTSCGVSSIL